MGTRRRRRDRRIIIVSLFFDGSRPDTIRKRQYYDETSTNGPRSLAAQISWAVPPGPRRRVDRMPPVPPR